jgi:hypothetical protein
MAPPGAQSEVDTIALTKATEALTRIAVHERSCDQRYLEITTGQKAIFKKLDELGRAQFKQWLSVAGGLILLLIAIVGFLFVKVQGW